MVCSIVTGQTLTKRALFLGNSYTNANNLPQMVADVASSTGDTLLFDSNTPGGYTLQGHTTNQESLAKIASGNWDYVVLQEQSQLPSFPISQVETEVFPYARILDSMINAVNPCAETVFYMTWGRKNGDASNCSWWPPVCTFAGMDSLLNLRYRMMADSNEAIVSPVGAVWKYIRQNFPSIELYQADESHPSVAGTYAAACSFYTTVFRKDPANISFNSTLSATDAANIRSAVKLIVYDSLENWHIGEYDPEADFSYLVSGVYQVTFTNSSRYATNFYWSFGDGDTSSGINPTHFYPAPGEYVVTLIADKCGLSDTTFQIINITSVGINESYESDNLIIYPNPVSASLTLILNMTGNLTGNLTYSIVNLTGQEMRAGAIINSENRINVSSLSEGLYFLQLFDNKNLKGQYKFVKSAK
jgi:PKD repeat protein